MWSQALREVLVLRRCEGLCKDCEQTRGYEAGCLIQLYHILLGYLAHEYLGRSHGRGGGGGEGVCPCGTAD